MKIVEVIVSVAARSIEKPFTYIVPDDLGRDIGIGNLVAVPFGGREVPGFVSGLGDESGEKTRQEQVIELKEISSVISGPHFSQQSLLIAQWMSTYYASSLCNCLKLFTPPLGRNWRRPVKRRRLACPHLEGHSDVLVLSEEQVNALSRIDHLSYGKALLIDGVTGSGKTEIYLRAIRGELIKGKGALVLVPEISLTPQTVKRFQQRFGSQVAVLHSRLTPAQKAAQIELIRTGQARVVVGPRSALFAPMENVGMIIIDEEHDGSYKQESDPRYHCRDVALKMAELYKAKLVLGSATPSIETLYLVSTGTVESVKLPSRVNNKPLPPVSIVDMTAEFNSGNKSMFSQELTDSLALARDNNAKAIILINRRGFAQFLLCRQCGYVPMCNNCSTSLTYHASKNHLRCHHCNVIQHVPTTCPACNSAYIAAFGAGTQRVEHELGQIFPDWPVVRMDSDTTAKREGHEQLLAQFESLSTGVLLGTQMIAKGLDFPDVVVVGVLAADSSLNFAQYDAPERTYQLLEQVAGRAGRGEEDGSVIIQTYSPDHPALQAVRSHDRRILLRHELPLRKSIGYPPYVRLCNIVISSLVFQKAEETAVLVGKLLRDRQVNGVSVLGPAPCAIDKIKNRYRFHILLKAPRDLELGLLVSEVLKSMPAQKDVRITVDIDASSMM